nr:hypothetical protein [Tanacetum cinerariifolium]
VKENQEKDKIESKPDKNGKRGKAKKSLKQLQWLDLGLGRDQFHVFNFHFSASE